MTEHYGRKPHLSLQSKLHSLGFCGDDSEYFIDCNVVTAMQMTTADLVVIHVLKAEF